MISIDDFSLVDLPLENNQTQSEKSNYMCTKESNSQSLTKIRYPQNKGMKILFKFIQFFYRCKHAY